MSVQDFIEFMVQERKRRGLSRRQFAEELKFSASVIGDIENGKQKPSIEFLRIFAKYLGKYTEELQRLAYPDDFLPTGQATVDPSDRLILEEFNRLPKSIRDFILTAVMDYGGVGDASKKGK